MISFTKLSTNLLLIDCGAIVGDFISFVKNKDNGNFLSLSYSPLIDYDIIWARLDSGIYQLFKVVIIKICFTYLWIKWTIMQRNVGQLYIDH